MPTPAKRTSPAKRAAAAPKQPHFNTGRRNPTRGKKLSPEQVERRVGAKVEAEAIRDYLEVVAIPAGKKSRGRAPQHTRMIAKIEQQLRDGVADPLKRMQLLADLERRRAQNRQGDVFAELRAGFVKHAKRYGERKRISYAVWRSMGVAAADLKAAGIAVERRRG